jgi:hypothetical protein
VYAYLRHIHAVGRKDIPERTALNVQAVVITLAQVRPDGGAQPGAGDSFRAGLLSYLVRNVDAFRDGNLNVADCLQMGNLFASLYIKAPLGDRYANIKQYDELARLVSADAGRRH